MTDKSAESDKPNPDETFFSPTWCAEFFASLEPSLRGDRDKWVQSMDYMINHWPDEPPGELLRIRSSIENDPTTIAKLSTEGLDRIVTDAREKQLFRRDVAQLRDEYARGENDQQPQATLQFYCVVGIKAAHLLRHAARQFGWSIIFVPEIMKNFIDCVSWLESAVVSIPVVLKYVEVRFLPDPVTACGLTGSTCVELCWKMCESLRNKIGLALSSVGFCC